jgi:hypothetical protein
MPKPQWGWALVALGALVAGVICVSIGLGNFDGGSGPPGGLLISGLGLLAVWSFGKAFFNFHLPPRN